MVAMEGRVTAGSARGMVGGSSAAPVGARVGTVELGDGGARPVAAAAKVAGVECSAAVAPSGGPAERSPARRPWGDQRTARVGRRADTRGRDEYKVGPSFWDGWTDGS